MIDVWLRVAAVVVDDKPCATSEEIVAAGVLRLREAEREARPFAADTGGAGPLSLVAALSAATLEATFHATFAASRRPAHMP